jgi:hypothetical protein
MTATLPAARSSSDDRLRQQNDSRPLRLACDDVRSVTLPRSYSALSAPKLTQAACATLLCSYAFVEYQDARDAQVSQPLRLDPGVSLTLAVSCRSPIRSSTACA